MLKDGHMQHLKFFSEHKILAYNEEKNLDYTIVRFFGSYGRNQNLTWWGGPQSVFIDKAIQNSVIELHGDGQQTRTFTYINDTVQGLVLSIEKEEARQEIFNIASEPKQEITIENLAIIIWKLVNGDDSDPKLKLIPYSTFGKYEDVKRRVPNINKIKNVLGYNPKYDLYEGMKKTIEWQKSLING
jgi:UDP-glucose 4-epimerase